MPTMLTMTSVDDVVLRSHDQWLHGLEACGVQQSR
jgi:hypothetical protein